MSTRKLRETALVLTGVALFSDNEAARIPPDEFLVLKYGKTAYTKGDAKGEYDFTPADADKVLADFETRDRALVIDWEHQTLTGARAPAAGWIEKLIKGADGIVAKLRYWTEDGLKDLKAGAYRYFSPVLTMSRQHPLSLHSVGLTNHPATHGVAALVASDDADTDPDETTTATQETAEMDRLKQLAEAMGIPLALADGKMMDEGAMMKAMDDMVQQMAGMREKMKAFLKLHDLPDLDAVTGKIKGMVPAVELTALNDRLALIDAEKAVAAAFTARKLVEAQREWALGYAKTQPQAFAAFVAAAPAVAPAAAATLNLADGGNVSTDDSLALTDESLGRHFDRTPSLAAEGFTKASYAAYRKAEAAGLVRNAPKTAKE